MTLLNVVGVSFSPIVKELPSMIPDFIFGRSRVKSRDPGEHAHNLVRPGRGIFVSKHLDAFPQNGGVDQVVAGKEESSSHSNHPGLPDLLSRSRQLEWKR
jgi:hypothetical protein